MDDEIETPLEPIAGVFTDLGTAQIVPPQWIIESLVPVGLVILGGPPKSNKSTLCMAISALVAGLPCRALPPFLSKVVRPGPVMGFSAEANAGELRHLCEQGMGVSVPAHERILICDDPFSWRLDDPDGQQQFLKWLEERDPRIAFIDPFRDFHSQEEKDSGEMNRLLRPLQQWAKKHESAIVIVHHTRKKGEDGRDTPYDASDLRGSGALFGLADAVLMMTPGKNGEARVQATFKRASGWDLMLRPAWYGNVGQRATEVLSTLDDSVLAAIVKVPGTIAVLAAGLHQKPERLQPVLEKLLRNGLVRTDKKGTFFEEKRQ